MKVGDTVKVISAIPTLPSSSKQVGKCGIITEIDSESIAAVAIEPEGIVFYYPLDSLRSHQNTVDHPPHYTSHPSGIECIEITRHMGFNLGNAMKYIWRADLKESAIEDLKKAKWYIDDELNKRSHDLKKVK